jgi:hypothetical protein
VRRRYALEVVLDDNGSYLQYILLYRKPLFGGDFRLAKRSLQTASNDVHVARDTFDHWRGRIEAAGVKVHEGGHLVDALS